MICHAKTFIFIIHRGTQLNNNKQSRVILPPTGEMDTSHKTKGQPIEVITPPTSHLLNFA